MYCPYQRGWTIIMYLQCSMSWFYKEVQIFYSLRFHDHNRQFRRTMKSQVAKKKSLAAMTTRQHLFLLQLLPSIASTLQNLEHLLWRNQKSPLWKNQKSLLWKNQKRPLWKNQKLPLLYRRKENQLLFQRSVILIL